MPITFVFVSLIIVFLFFVFRRNLKGKRIKIFTLWTVLSLLATLILFNTGFFGSYIDVDAADSRRFSREELVQDLKQIERTIMDKNPLIFADREKLKVDFQNTYDLIEDEMTELEFYRLISPLIADINCGHTNLYISEASIGAVKPNKRWRKGSSSVKYPVSSLTR